MISISSSPLSLSLMPFNVSSNFNTSSSLLYPFSKKQYQLSKTRKPKHHQIACTSNDTNQNNPKEQEQKQSPRKFVDKFPIVLDSAVSTIVKRPKKSRSSKEKEDEEEILVIDGIEFDDSNDVKFDVIVNDEDDKVIGVENTEFAGSFVSLSHSHNHGNKKKKKNSVTSLRLGLTDLLEGLNADDDDTIVVTLIPRYGDDVKISGIKIEFES